MKLDTLTKVVGWLVMLVAAVFFVVAVATLARAEYRSFHIVPACNPTVASTVDTVETSDLGTIYDTSLTAVGGVYKNWRIGFKTGDLAGLAFMVYNSDTLSDPGLLAPWGDTTTRTDTVYSGASTTSLVCDSLTQANDYWNGGTVLFLSGTATGQTAVVADFVAATDSVAFAAAIDSTPVAGDSFLITRKYVDTIPSVDYLKFQAHSAGRAPAKGDTYILECISTDAIWLMDTVAADTSAVYAITPFSRVASTHQFKASADSLYDSVDTRVYLDYSVDGASFSVLDSVDVADTVVVLKQWNSAAVIPGLFIRLRLDPVDAKTTKAGTFNHRGVVLVEQ